jgi:hypothetical protein
MEPRPKRVITFRKQENIQRDLQADCRAGGPKVNSRNFCQTSEDECQDVMEESATTKIEQETASNIRARDVGAPATLGSFARTVGKEDVGGTPGPACTLSGNHSG